MKLDFKEIHSHENLSFGKFKSFLFIMAKTPAQAPDSTARPVGSGGVTEHVLPQALPAE